MYDVHAYVFISVAITEMIWPMYGLLYYLKEAKSRKWR